MTDVFPFRCSKAVNINEQLKTIGGRLTDLCQAEERLGQVGPQQLEESSLLLGRVAGLLRADVSILIPSSLGRAEPSVSHQARNIVAEADCPRLLVEETLDFVAKLVYKLLSVETCGVCHPESHQMDIDPDIMNMVAAMCGDYSNLPGTDTDRENRWVDWRIPYWFDLHNIPVIADLKVITRLEGKS